MPVKIYLFDLLATCELIEKSPQRSNINITKLIYILNNILLTSPLKNNKKFKPKYSLGVQVS
jgi:hypothetical protein